MKNFVDEVTKTADAGEIFDDAFVGAPAAEPVPLEAAEMDPVLMRKEAVSDVKRGFIMDAALRAIARDGFAAVRLEDIAREAGFSKASIYHYFPDKDALLIHIMLRAQRAMHEKYQEIVTRDLPFVETIREFVHAFYDKILGGDGLYSAFASNMSMTSAFAGMAGMVKHEDLFKASIMAKQETFGLMTHVVAKAKASGALTIPMDDEIVCSMISAFLQTFMMKNMMSNWIVTAEKVDANKAVEYLLVFFKPWINEDVQHRRWYDVTGS